MIYDEPIYNNHTDACETILSYQNNTFITKINDTYYIKMRLCDARIQSFMESLRTNAIANALAKDLHPVFLFTNVII